MTPFELISTLLLLVLCATSVYLLVQVRGAARDTRGEARETRARQQALAGHTDAVVTRMAALDESLGAGVERIDALERALIAAMREMLAGHQQAAVEIIARAEQLPPPHRHHWRVSSEESTNGKRIRFKVCAVSGCGDVDEEEVQ